MAKQKQKKDECACCHKTHAESPRREFSQQAGGGLWGVCIACDKARNEKIEAERKAAREADPKLMAAYVKRIVYDAIISRVADIRHMAPLEGLHLLNCARDLLYEWSANADNPELLKVLEQRVQTFKQRFPIP